MTSTITRVLEFDAGHRLVGHEGKCANMHGHRYRAEITCTAKSLDGVGRVIDFAKIKELVGGWIDENWDHGFIYNVEDPIAGEFFDKNHTQKNFRVQCEPTAENMSRILANIAQGLLTPYSISVCTVRLYETPNCWAEFAPDADIKRP